MRVPQSPVPHRQFQRTAGLLAVLLPILLSGLLGLSQPRVSHAASQPSGGAALSAPQVYGLPLVRYDEVEQVIYIGNNYEDYIGSDPANAQRYEPYVTHPSHPDAPKEAITLPELHQALIALGRGDLLIDEGSGVWLLASDVMVLQSARLEVAGPVVTWLKLDSTPTRSPAFVRLIATGGHLRFYQTRVTSWDGTSATVDENHEDGRSWLLAEQGGRMDIEYADVSYLGMGPGEPSGLSWRKRADEEDPVTGATGSIMHSDIHHNYFGQYSYEAYGLIAKYNKFRDNMYYGFDPHDFSTHFEVAYNEVYANGKHGIIFSRGCEYNTIHHNIVYGNAHHGIMLDRGTNNNRVFNNIIYNNRDGIAIFQSSNNLIQNNRSFDNERGIRINATYDTDDIYDGISTGNRVISNTFSNNTQYGVYLYERADENLIYRNQVSGSGVIGVYIKTGANTIEANEIRANGHGITIIGSDPYTRSVGLVPYVEPIGQPGSQNTVFHNLIEDNVDTGIQVRAASGNRLGLYAADLNQYRGNTIRTNGSDGIVLKNGATDNSVVANTLGGNGRHGVLVKHEETLRNRISRNSFFANNGLGISLSNGSHNGVSAPTLTSAPGATPLQGTAPPSAEVEIYRGQNGQGQDYLGTAVADADGTWEFPLPTTDNPSQGDLILLAIDQDANTSEFFSTAPIVLKATYTVEPGTYGEPIIYINGSGSEVTLPELLEGVQALTSTALLEHQGAGVWQANAGIFVGRGVTLTLSSDTVSWLKLRSQRGDIQLSADNPAVYNYRSFVALRTHNGVIRIDGVTITSWDPHANAGKGDYDHDISDGRSYLLAKYAARMDITDSTLSYLGSADGESYGIAWRDINSSDAPDVLRTRVTGEVLNSTFSYNYYGQYSYQASYMVFRGNKFHNNIGYGFDPHDVSHHFIVEDNESFENGNHGFIISRGCHNFIFRNNKSYNNRYTVGDSDAAAHGFMLDPGSPNSRYPQIASYNNLLENNEAWGNQGYGLRILGSVDNTVRGNTFTDNGKGLTLDGVKDLSSTGNIIEDNIISGSLGHGIYTSGNSGDNTIRNNVVTGSGSHGIYIKTSNNTIAGNTLRANGSIQDGRPRGAGIALLPETPAADDDQVNATLTSLASEVGTTLSAYTSTLDVPRNNRIRNNTIAESIDDGIEIKGAEGTLVEENVIEHNGVHGVYISGYQDYPATNTIIHNNTMRNNTRQGIRANGAMVQSNSWSANSVYGNLEGGIVTTSGANDGVEPPAIYQVDRLRVTGVVSPNAQVEIYSDMADQGQYYEGSATADATGAWTFTLPTGRSWQAPNINAFMTDAAGNSSAFSGPDQVVHPVYIALLLQ